MNPRLLLCLALCWPLSAWAQSVKGVPPFLETLDLPILPTSDLALRRAAHLNEVAAHPVHAPDEAAALGAANYENLTVNDWNILHQDLTIDINWTTGAMVLDAILTVHANQPGVTSLDFLDTPGQTWTAALPDGPTLDVASVEIQQGYAKYTVTLPNPLASKTDNQVIIHRASKLDCSAGFMGFLQCNLAGTYKWVTGSVGLRLYPGNHDPFAVTQHIYTSASEVAAATGTPLGSVVQPDGRLLWTFDNPERGDNTDAFAVSAYKIFANTGAGGMPIRIYTVSNYAGRAPGIAQFVSEVFEFYAPRMTPFPWKEMNMIQLSGKFGGGESFLQGIFAIESVFGATPGDNGWSNTAELLSHELAHQWWGNLVAPQTLSDVCLSESLAEFSSCWYTETALQTRSQLIGNNLGFVYTVGKADDRAVHSANVYGASKYVDIIYHKGSTVFDMLRREIGDEAMAAGLKAYAQAYGRDYATLAQQRALLEQAAGRDLAWFFTQWFDRPGYIRAQLAARSTPNEDGTWTVHLRVLQPSDPANSKQKPYRFHLPVHVELAGGQPAVDLMMDVSAVADVPQLATFIVPGAPLRVKCDWERKLLRKFVISTPGDVNLSGLVDGGDLVDMAYRQGRSIVVNYGNGQQYFLPDPSWNELYDINQDTDGNVTPDGSIDGDDLKALNDWYGFTAEEF